VKLETVKTTHRRDIISALFVLSILGMMLIRIPYLMLDMFLALSIAVSLMILFVALNLKKSLDFSVFPTVLLLVTLFRLALSVAATRLILMDGIDFNGKIIQTLGSFLLYGNPVVGLVIFAVIFVVQMKVVTAGATRIAEVAARFTLDALPGKQLALVADMNAGLLSEEEMLRRRNELNQQADFYGAMDGAFRFVRGDAVANVFIALINLVGGLLIGVFYSKLSFQEALGIYAVLTVGSGLASQVPALIISLASGLVITKASSSEYIGFDLKKQLFVNPKALQWTAVILLLLIVMGMPALPFLMLSVGIFSLALVLKRQSESKALEENSSHAAPLHVEPPSLQMDVIEIEVGLGLIGFDA
jgi:flagellar biosynthesis protein FlhA